jgi:DNA-binding NtrC family response regulator
MTTAKNILVLDDQIEIALLLSEVLRDERYSVNFFTCPDKAKSFFEENHDNIDFLITDYHLAPNTTGLDVVRFCHQFSEIPYILISGNMNRVTDVYNKNEIARLEKPFSHDDILLLISG